MSLLYIYTLLDTIDFPIDYIYTYNLCSFPACQNLRSSRRFSDQLEEHLRMINVYPLVI